MLTTSLLALALALPPSGAESHWQLSLGGAFSYETYRRPEIVPPARSLGGSGSVAVTWFPRAVVDDDAPLSVQPFLQRATELELSGSGTGYFVSDPLSDAGDYGGASGSATASATGYPAPWLLLHARLGVEVNRPDVGPGLLSLPIELSAGGRFDDLLVAVGWHVTPTRVGAGALDVPFWGGVYVSAYEVFARRVALHVGVDVLDGGASIGGGATLYVARRLDLGISASGGRATVGDFAGAGGDVAWWFTRHVAATLSYRGDWERFASGSGELGAHVISLALVARPQ